MHILLKDGGAVEKYNAASGTADSAVVVDEAENAFKERESFLAASRVVFFRFVVSPAGITQCSYR